jgi:hypothetical protein
MTGKRLVSRLVVLLLVGCGGSPLHPDAKDAAPGEAPSTGNDAVDRIDAAVDQGMDVVLDVGPDTGADLGVPVDRMEVDDQSPEISSHVIGGPEGTYVITDVDPSELTIESSCAGFPTWLIETQAGPCLRITSGVLLADGITVCYPNQPPPEPGKNVIQCVSPVGASCPDRKRLFSGACCSEVSFVSGPDPLCFKTLTLGTFAIGVLLDTDGDFIPDVDDNCPTVFNPDQADSNNNGIGDACEGDGGTDGPGSNPG